MRGELPPPMSLSTVLSTCQHPVNWERAPVGLALMLGAAALGAEAGGGLERGLWLEGKSVGPKHVALQGLRVAICQVDTATSGGCWGGREATAQPLAA